MRDEGIRDFSEEQDTAPPMTDQMMEDEWEAFLREAREMVMLREQRDRIMAREKEIKPHLMDVLLTYGDPYGPEGQHLTINLDPPVRDVERLVRQRKVSNLVDEDEAAVIAKKRGVYDRLFPPVPTLDENEALVLLEEGILTDEDIDRMFPKSVSFAFVMERRKKNKRKQ